jgi:hypothetical protein
MQHHSRFGEPDSRPVSTSVPIGLGLVSRMTMVALIPFLTQHHPLKPQGHPTSSGPFARTFGQHLQRSARQVIHRLRLVELMMRNLSVSEASSIAVR